MTQKLPKLKKKLIFLKSLLNSASYLMTLEEIKKQLELLLKR